MPFPLLIPAITAGIGAIGGALNNRKSARTSTQTTTVNEPGEYKTLGDLLRQRALERLNSSADMSGYQAQGVSGINDAFRGITQASQNNLTSRGLATSPVAATVDTALGIARGGEIARFLNSLPLLQRQLQGEDIAQASGIFNARPLSTTVTGVAPGSMAGGAFNSAAELLAYLAGRGRLGGGGGG